MLNDRRGSRRYTINRIAKFQTDAYTLPRDCMISDISDSGARAVCRRHRHPRSIQSPDRQRRAWNAPPMRSGLAARLRAWRPLHRPCPRPAGASKAPSARQVITTSPAGISFAAERLGAPANHRPDWQPLLLNPVRSKCSVFGFEPLTTSFNHKGIMCGIGDPERFARLSRYLRKSRGLFLCAKFTARHHGCGSGAHTWTEAGFLPRMNRQPRRLRRPRQQQQKASCSTKTRARPNRSSALKTD